MFVIFPEWEIHVTGWESDYSEHIFYMFGGSVYANPRNDSFTGIPNLLFLVL